MRLTLLLLFMSFLNLIASESYSQLTKLTLSLKNVTVEQVLGGIEDKSEFNFVYNRDVIDLNRKVDVDYRDVKVNDILNDLFEDTNVTYRLIDRTIVLSTVSETASARQSRLVSGKVTDSSGAPLPGVTVVVKGTAQGTVTDGDGNYSLSNVAGNAVLVFSFVGMRTQEIAVSERNMVNIVMQEETVGIEEVVAVGYGTMRKEDITGAVSTVKQFDQRPTLNVLEGMQGKVAGVSILNGSGRPGGEISVNIRGLGSINASNTPLYVIDGIIDANIAYLNPNDIESIDILKDASATAIYGSRGANGVIMVTTKKQQKRASSIEYTGNFGISTLTREIDVLNSEEFMAMKSELWADNLKIHPDWANIGVDYGNDYPQYFNPDNSPKYDTNWQKEITRVAFSHQQYLSFSGRTEKFNGGLSLGLQDENGIIISTYMKKLSARFYGDYNVRDWLKLGGSFTIGEIEQSRLDDVAVGGTNIMRYTLEMPPIYPVKDANGKYTDMGEIKRKDNSFDIYPGENAVGMLEQDRQIEHSSNQLLANVYAEIDIAKGLTFRTSYNLKRQFDNTDTFDAKSIDFSNINYASMTNIRYSTWQFDNVLTFKRLFNDIHSLTIMAGESWMQNEMLRFRARASNFADDFYKFYNLGQGANPSNVLSVYSSDRLNSYFSRFNYSYKNKYLLTATGRYDGSSRFGASNKYAFFPSVALGWVISEENFMEGTQTIDNLKLKLSYGLTGNNSIGDYAAIGSPGTQEVIFNKQRVVGSSAGVMPNKDLKWEKNKEFNIGVEFGILNRASFSADAYVRKTSDLLYNKPIPRFTGYSSILSNIGSIENKGIELQLNTDNIRNQNFSWSSSISFSKNINEVLSLGTNNEDMFIVNLWDKTAIMRVGEPMASFFGYTRIGTWGSDEADEAASYGRKPGDIKWQDVNNDGKYDNSDNSILGNPAPDYEILVGNTFRYRNWDLSVDIRIVQGNEINDFSMHFIGDRMGYGNTYKFIYENAWRPDNQNTMVPRIRQDKEVWGPTDSYHIFDGSFIRGQNLTLSYNFSQRFLEKIDVTKLRLYANIQNFFLIDNYHGYDPEVGLVGGQFNRGNDFYSYPKPRTFNIGVNLVL